MRYREGKKVSPTDEIHKTLKQFESFNRFCFSFYFKYALSPRGLVVVRGVYNIINPS